jgi:hypothetical protein
LVHQSPYRFLADALSVGAASRLESLDLRFSRLLPAVRAASGEQFNFDGRLERSQESRQAITKTMCECHCFCARHFGIEISQAWSQTNLLFCRSVHIHHRVRDSGKTATETSSGRPLDPWTWEYSMLSTLACPPKSV